MLQVLPQFHVGGWNVQSILGWWKGATVVIEPGFDAAHALDVIERERVTTMMGVPANYDCERLPRRLAPDGRRRRVRSVGLVATASYLPERWMTAAEIATAAGIPEEVIVEKFGVRGKHIAAPDEHVSDLSVRAAERLLDETGFDPEAIDVVMYYGSMWRDYAVWQSAPHIAYRIGATNAFAIEYDNVSHGTPIALRLARDLLRAEEELKNVLVVAACRESYLLDYANARSRFMFNFGDGAVAGLLRGGDARNEILGSHTLTNGAYSLQVKVPGGGSVEPDGYRFLDVQDPAEMKAGLDQESLAELRRGCARRGRALGLELSDLAFVCPLHTKRSMFVALLSELGMREDQGVYLDDTGHMSGVDSLLGLDRAVREGRVRDGDNVLLLSAGTGYTWAATVVRWGGATP